MGKWESFLVPGTVVDAERRTASCEELTPRGVSVEVKIKQSVEKGGTTDEV